MTEVEHTEIAGRSLILYDGVCGLCNRVVQRLLRLDRADSFRFAPLESPLGIEMLGLLPFSPTEPEGVILVAHAFTPDQTIYRRFDAVRESMRSIPGPYRLLGTLLRLVPRFLHEWGYGMVARNRYRLFGKYDACPIPTPDQRSRILGM